jgi:hypothetical protein
MTIVPDALVVLKNPSVLKVSCRIRELRQSAFECTILNFVEEKLQLLEGMMMFEEGVP